MANMVGAAIREKDLYQQQQHQQNVDNKENFQWSAQNICGAFIFPQSRAALLLHCKLYTYGNKI